MELVCLLSQKMPIKHFFFHRTFVLHFDFVLNIGKLCAVQTKRNLYISNLKRMHSSTSAKTQINETTQLYLS